MKRAVNKVEREGKSQTGKLKICSVVCFVWDAIIKFTESQEGVMISIFKGIALYMHNRYEKSD